MIGHHNPARLGARLEALHYVSQLDTAKNRGFGLSRFAPKSQGGDMRSRWNEERRDEVLALWEANRDLTLDELRVALAGIGLSVANDLGAVLCALRHHTEKTGLAIEQDRMTS